MMKPLIGITAGTIHNAEFPFYPFTYGQMHTYAEAVVAAGGVPVIIPIGKTPVDAQEILDRLDGVLFAGGNDIGPKQYNEEAQHVEKRGVDEPRDTFEIALMKEALARHVPILAICRGMQLLNVVRGGTLYQDIDLQVTSAGEHEGRLIAEDFQHVAHKLALVPGTSLATILNSTHIESNSHHHQAVKQLGKGLTINAHAEDGIIEGVEDMADGYVMGVQSHPEAVVVSGRHASPWYPLFDSFVTAARGYAAKSE